MQSPHISPRISPPELFLNEDINPPIKEEKYNEPFDIMGIKVSLVFVYVIKIAHMKKRKKHIITLITDETKLLLYGLFKIFKKSPSAK